MQGGGDELSIEELASNLSTYKEQLDQVLVCIKFDILLHIFPLVIRIFVN